MIREGSKGRERKGIKLMLSLITIRMNVLSSQYSSLKTGINLDPKNPKQLNTFLKKVKKRGKSADQEGLTKQSSV